MMTPMYQVFKEITKNSPKLKISIDKQGVGMGSFYTAKLIDPKQNGEAKNLLSLSNYYNAILAPHHSQNKKTSAIYEVYVGVRPMENSNDQYVFLIKNGINDPHLGFNLPTQKFCTEIGLSDAIMINILSDLSKNGVGKVILSNINGDKTADLSIEDMISICVHNEGKKIDVNLEKLENELVQAMINGDSEFYGTSLSKLRPIYLRATEKSKATSQD